MVFFTLLHIKMKCTESFQGRLWNTTRPNAALTCFFPNESHGFSLQRIIYTWVCQDTSHGFVDFYQTVPAEDWCVNPQINSTYSCLYPKTKNKKFYSDCNSKIQVANRGTLLTLCLLGVTTSNCSTWGNVRILSATHPDEESEDILINAQLIPSTKVNSIL